MKAVTEVKFFSEFLVVPDFQLLLSQTGNGTMFAGALEPGGGN